MENNDQTDPTAKQTENSPPLKPHLFQPGQSGNPSGRPKGAISIMSHLRKALQESYEGKEEGRARMVAEAIILQAAKGNGVALRQLLDRIDGTVTQKVVVTVSESVQTDLLLSCIARRFGEEEFEAVLTDWHEELIKSNLASISTTPELSGFESEQP